MNTEYITKAVNVAKAIYARGINLDDLPDPMMLIDQWRLSGKQPEVTLTCPYCGALHKRSLYYYLSALSRKKYLPGNFCCSALECIAKNKSAVIAEQTFRRETSARGHIVTQEQKDKRMETLIKRGTIHSIYDKIHARKGRKVEDIYGIEKGTIIRQKIKENTPHPETGFFKGCRHTPETKKRLSEKSSSYFQSDSYLIDKKFSHPVTGDPCSHKEWLAAHNRKVYFDKTDSERLAIIQKQITSLQSELMINHPYWGLHRAWFECSATQPFRSSWELLYMEYLDSKRIYYESNKTLYVPYRKLSGLTAYYIPDFLIYDGMFISEIVEIKPSKLAKADINQIKFKAAELVCRLNNMNFVVLTEVELIKIGIAIPGSSRKESTEFWKGYENSKNNKVYRR
jgi:hypothetical protein